MFWFVPGIPRQRPATPALVREGGVAPGWHNNQKGPLPPPLLPPTPLSCPPGGPSCSVAGPPAGPGAFGIGRRGRVAAWLRQGRRQPSGKSSDGRAREPTQDMVSEVGSAAPAAGTTQPPAGTSFPTTRVTSPSTRRPSTRCRRSRRGTVRRRWLPSCHHAHSGEC